MTSRAGSRSGIRAEVPRPIGWKQLSTSPDWMAFMRVGARETPTKDVPRVVLMGEVGGISLGDLVSFLGSQRWSGALEVMTSNSERQLIFKSGDVRAAQSDDTAESFREVLVGLGLVERVGAMRLERERGLTGVALGRLLLDEGKLQPHDLYRALQELVGRVFHGMMSSTRGTFTLSRVVLDERELPFNLSLNAQNLLMDQVRRVDEWARFREHIPHSRTWVVRVREAEDSLPEDETQILDALAQPRTVAAIGTSCRVSEFEATRGVYRLLQAGFVRVSPAGPPPPERPSVSTTTREQTAVEVDRILEGFQRVYQEIHDELSRAGQLEKLLASANQALATQGFATSPLMAKLRFNAEGMEVSATRAVALGFKGDVAPALKRAMNDVILFLLFHSSELLATQVDDDLAERVKRRITELELR